MTRTEAVTRIREGLGFRASGPMDEVIVRRLQEAQRNLERGKTLPRFLLQEDAVITLPIGEYRIDLPTGFIRPDFHNPIHYVTTPEGLPVYLEPRSYVDALIANQLPNFEAAAPKIYVIRQSYIDFINPPDVEYTLYWNYYAKAVVLDSDVENAWLADDAGSEWLIGEAGYRIARNMRDADAVADFDKMRTEGRAALFADIIAFEDAAEGPFIMGGES